MSGIEIIGVISILIIGGVFYMLFNWLSKNSKRRSIFNFKRDHEEATYKEPYKSEINSKEFIFIGHSVSKKRVLMENDAKHVFICGTTGSGKTVALSNFIKSGADYNYPMLIIDGKGDTNVGSLLDITKKLCPERKLYVINLNDPSSSDKYNPFKNTNTDVIKDMLINMTTWSEDHYKYNAERYIQRLLKLMALNEIDISLASIVRYLLIDNFNELSKDLSVKELITKEERLEDSELAKISGKIAEGAAARFAVIKESSLGQIFDSSGIDIYTALEENAIILFILNPLLYPEMSPLIGNLIIIDSKKAVSNFYRNKKNRIFYILDEINVYASNSLLDLVNKSRSANITCILATQSLSDLDSVNEQFKEQVIENCNNYIALRQNSAINADAWANIFGTKVSMQPTYQIKDGVSTDLGSLRKTREFIYHPDDIKTLRLGKAIFLSRDTAEHTKVNVIKPF
ncbi:MAG: type IV secretion system DNA-binding domain-containing protein [Defluviitaleaceae bacterium]|nr:type IV secretion system DNA-binding domain-containing protein [Defluviitaleaceae bacterium]